MQFDKPEDFGDTEELRETDENVENIIISNNNIHSKKELNINNSIKIDNKNQKKTQLKRSNVSFST